MTQQELISKLQTLKQISPRKDWVVLSKMNILQTPLKPAPVPAYKTIFSSISKLVNQKQFAYALATLLFVFIGGVGIVKFGLPQSSNLKVANQHQSAASLAQETALKNSLQDFKVKSETLAQVIQGKPSVTPSAATKEVAIKEATTAAKNLTDNIAKNPELAKTFALDINNNKTLLNIPGGSAGDQLKKDLNAPYEALVKQLLEDEQKMTLTADQKMVVDNVIKLDKQGNDADALVNLLLLRQSKDDSKNASTVAPSTP